ncbi:MAG TPA: MSMEG_4193 family putative phosphomutase [Marmoricola sp.]
MPTLILARHGRTAANAKGVLAGRTPGVGLDETGRDQARAAAERLTDVPLTMIVSSPLQRCRETAAVLAAGHRIRVRTDAGLNECDYGDWAGQKLSTLARRKLWTTVQRQPSAAHFPGGESLQEMSARAVRAVRRRDAAVAEEHGAAATWLAVSHGDIIKAILADALGMHLDEFQRIVVDPASLSVIRYTPERTFVLTTNSTSGPLAAPTGRPTSAAVVGGGAGPATS